MLMLSMLILFVFRVTVTSF